MCCSHSAIALPAQLSDKWYSLDVFTFSWLPLSPVLQYTWNYLIVFGFKQYFGEPLWCHQWTIRHGSRSAGNDNQSLYLPAKASRAINKGHPPPTHLNYATKLCTHYILEHLEWQRLVEVEASGSSFYSYGLTSSIERQRETNVNEALDI